MTFEQKIPVTISVEGSRALNWYVCDQREWSRHVFGTDQRTVGICNHIRAELHEIESDPADVKEWIDVIILAMDGYWRAGGDPAQLFNLLLDKQRVNFARQWPATPPPPDQASFHLKEPIIGRLSSQESNLVPDHLSLDRNAVAHLTHQILAEREGRIIALMRLGRCPACNGTGKLVDRCDICKGNGQWRGPDPDDLDAVTHYLKVMADPSHTHSLHWYEMYRHFRCSCGYRVTESDRQNMRR